MLKIHHIICMGSLAIPSLSHAFTLELNNGFFFGPGDALYVDTGITGVNRFPDAQVRNIELLGPLQGVIPFANNGEKYPNVIAEELVTNGIIDGAASDGTLINENADTALRLHFKDLKTEEYADVMVVAEKSELPGGGEPILPDENGNLTFNPSVLADPGDPDLISRFNVSFTTGAAEVPVSKKTYLGEAGGVDAAGPLPAGKVLVGRLGDYDQDGFMDGILVLATNSPEDLVVARGNPIAQIRPWSSDIPIAPEQAAFLTLNNLLMNYPFALTRSEEQGDFASIIEHLDNMNEGLVSISGNLRRFLSTSQILSDKNTTNQVISTRNKIARAQKMIASTTALIDKTAIRGMDKHFYKRVSRTSMKIQYILFTLKGIAEDLNGFQS